METVVSSTASFIGVKATPQVAAIASSAAIAIDFDELGTRDMEPCPLRYCRTTIEAQQVGRQLTIDRRAGSGESSCA